MMVEEVLQSMYGISSDIENTKMEVSQDITIYTYSVKLAYNWISIIIYLKTPVLYCIYSKTLGHEVYSYTLPLY